jgi:hypothetical protein
MLDSKVKNMKDFIVFNNLNLGHQQYLAQWRST